MKTGARKSQGAAVVTALLIVALATTLVSGLFWQLQVALRAVENQRARTQINWVLRGALDWAEVILDSDNSRQNVTTLDQSWAIPIPETRLSAYLEKTSKDAFVSDDDEEAFLEGRIIDAQSRFNLTALASEGKTVEVQIKAFKKLLEILGANPNLAEPAALYVAKSQRSINKVFALPLPPGQQPPQSQQPLQENETTQLLGFNSVDDLRQVSGFDEKLVTRLKSYCVVLPETNNVLVNVNTASAEVIYASVDKMTIAQAKQLVQIRKKTYFNNTGDVQNNLGTQDIDLARLSVNSNYFIVRGKVRLGRARRTIEALVNRPQSGGGKTKLVQINEAPNAYEEEAL